MSNLTKGIILVVAILAVGAGLVVWKKNAGGTAHASSLNTMTREEVELLLGDVAKNNPMILKRLAEDPEMKKTQIENLKQLLAFASQAQRDGLANEGPNKQELDNIRTEVIAVSYDREMNKDKGPMPCSPTDDMTTLLGYNAGTSETRIFRRLKNSFSGGPVMWTPVRRGQFNDFLMPDRAPEAGSRT